MYQITDIDFDKDTSHTFEDRKKNKTSLLDYYAKKYNLKIRDVRQPLILWRDKRNPSNEIFLVPELCTVTGLTDALRSNFNCKINDNI